MPRSASPLCREECSCMSEHQHHSSAPPPCKGDLSRRGLLALFKQRSQRDDDAQ